MTKTRMTVWEVKAVVQDLRKRILGMRVANLYDINQKILVLKLARPDTPKIFVLVESGVRLHSTNYNRESQTVASNFSAKLKKHLKGVRCESISQDRLVRMTFGSGELMVHLFLEFYAAGNIILTDRNFMILALLRPYALEETKVSVGKTYLGSVVAPSAGVRVGEDSSASRESDPLRRLSDLSPEELLQFLVARRAALLSPAPGAESKSAVASKKSKKNSQLHRVVLDFDSHLGALGSNFVEHYFLEQGLPTDDLTDIVPTIDLCEKIASIVQNLVAMFEQDDFQFQGVLFKNETGYSDAVPYLWKQDENQALELVESFDLALDKYFSQFDEKKSIKEKDQEKSKVLDKYTKIEKDQQNRIDSLQSSIETQLRKAELIEYHSNELNALLQVIQSYIAQEKSWDFILHTIEIEKSSGNPLLENFHSIDFLHGELRMEYPLDSLLSEDEEGVDYVPLAPVKTVLVELDINLNVYQNLSKNFDLKKYHAEKLSKTVEASQQILKKAKKDVSRQLDKIKSQQIVFHGIRKTYWFEKFHWCFSSEGFILIGGRDAQQNELLFKKYIRPTDVFVHADVFGSCACVIRNDHPDQPIPEQTVLEAGAFTVCHSQSWKNQLLSKAYWVYPSQVSKTAPSGEYLKVGGFMIRGKKNYIDVSKLEMGFGVIFEIDKDSAANHSAERVPKSAPLILPFGIQKVDFSLPSSELREANGIPPLAQESCQAHAVELRGEFAGEPQEEEEEIEEDSFPVASALETLLSSSSSAQPLAAALLEQGGAVSHPKSKQSPSPDYKSAAFTQLKPKISRFQRKEMKKKSACVSRSNSESEDESPSVKTVSESRGTTEKSKGPIPKEYPRGKRSKVKRVQQKYRGQDEEDRRLAMEALGHKLADSAADSSSSRAPPSDGVLSAKDAVDSVVEQKECFACHQKGHCSRDCPLKPEASPSLDGEQPPRPVPPPIVDVTSDSLSLFVGTPLPEDVLVSAIPICAPVSALQSSKYLVSLVPGPLKRGQALKTVSEMFIRRSEGREKELLRAISTEEWNLVMLSLSQVVLPGQAVVKSKGKAKAKAR